MGTQVAEGDGSAAEVLQIGKSFGPLGLLHALWQEDHKGLEDTKDCKM